MAVFLFGVAVGWISTFALWVIWSFGWMSGLLLGALAGTAAIFAFFAVQWVFRGLTKAPSHSDLSAYKNVYSSPEKAGFRP